MNEKLLKRLGLAAEAPPEAIETAVSNLLDHAEDLEQKNAELKKTPVVAETTVEKLEKRIRAKIAESGGALNREQALVALAHQDEAKAKAPKAKK